MVEQWLVDTEAAYVNATLPEMLQVGSWFLDGGTVTLLTLCIVCNGAYTGRSDMPHWSHEVQMIAIADYDFQMLAIARMLLEHGADANLDDGHGVCPLEYASQHVFRNALPWFDLLLECGANPNVTVRARASPSFDTTLLGKIISNGGLRMGRKPGQGRAPGQILGLARALLRAGARADSPHNDGTNPTWVLEQWRRCLEKRRRYHWKRSVRRRRSHDLDPHFIELSNLITGVAAAGSFKRWLLRAHIDVLILRTQIQRGRAALPPRRRRPRGRDAKQRNALAFVLRQGDNGVVWNILSFCHGSGETLGNYLGCYVARDPASPPGLRARPGAKSPSRPGAGQWPRSPRSYSRDT